MRKIVVALDRTESIVLGRQGEKNAVVVVWDISEWKKNYGEGTATLLYTMEGGENSPYPCQVRESGNQVEWLITPTELMLSSRGKCQLIYCAANETLVKSPVYQTRVQGSLGEKITDPPESFIGWADNLLKMGTQVLEATKRVGEISDGLAGLAQETEERIIQAGSRTENTVQEAERVTNQLESLSEQVLHVGAQVVSDAEQAGQAAVQAAKQAVSAADKAIRNAESAQESADIVADILPIPTQQDNGKILTVVDGKWASVDPAVSSWEKVQLIIRAGLAPQYFPVGYEFATHDSTNNTDIIWRVVGYDTIKAVDKSLKHTMVLETKYAYCNSNGINVGIQFDAPEILYFAETGLQAGTYHFTLPSGYDTLYGGGKTYSFTLSQQVPINGAIRFPWAYNQQAASTKVSTYASSTSNDIIESVSVSEGSEGLNLGKADGQTNNMNHIQRVRFGSNNYAQSAVRRWLNSKEEVDNIWQPTTKFDSAPGYISSGFMSSLPTDFLEVVQTAAVPCRANSLYEENSLDGTVFTTNQMYVLADKFFLLSQPEIFGTWENESINDGEILDFYTDLINLERIKYTPSGTAVICWMRSPTSSESNYNKSVSLSGSISGILASNSMGICPACIIA